MPDGNATTAEEETKTVTTDVLVAAPAEKQNFAVPVALVAAVVAVTLAVLFIFFRKKKAQWYEKNSDRLLKSINYQLIQHEDYINEQVQNLTNIIAPPNKKKIKKKLFKSKSKQL